MKNQLCRENVETQPVSWNFSANLMSIKIWKFQPMFGNLYKLQILCGPFFADKQGADLGRLLIFGDV